MPSWPSGAVGTELLDLEQGVDVRRRVLAHAPVPGLPVGRAPATSQPIRSPGA
jgi:hypothetical protein